MARIAVLLVAVVAVTAAWMLLSDREPERLGSAGIGRVPEESTPPPPLASARRLPPTPIPVAGVESDYGIHGRVVDEAERPLAGVPVTVRPFATGDDASSIASPPRELPPHVPAARSGDDGTFDLVVSGAGTYVVRAEPPAGAAGSSKLVFLPNAERKTVVVLHVTSGHALQGRVVDGADRGADAVLEGFMSARAHGKPRLFTAGPIATSMPMGAFAFEGLAAGEWSFSVTLPGRLTFAVENVSVPRSGPLVVRVPATGIVRGTVTDRKGAPVEGAVVSVAVPQAGWLWSSASSRPDGTWRLEVVAGEHPPRVTATAPGFVRFKSDGDGEPWDGSGVPQGGEFVVPIVLRRGATVFGVTKEEETGRPLAGVRVVLQTEGHGSKDTLSDAEGRYQFDDCAAGRGLLEASTATHHLALLTRGDWRALRPGEKSLPTPPPPEIFVVVPEGEAIERDLVLAAGLRIRGRVVGPSGEAVADAFVASLSSVIRDATRHWLRSGTSLSTPFTRTRPDGTFDLGGLPPGLEWTFTANADGFAQVRIEGVRIDVGVEPFEIVFDLVRAAGMRGRIVDAAGRGVPFARLEVTGDSDSNSAYTAADGTFSIEDLAPGTFKMSVGADGFRDREDVDIGAALAPGEQRELADVQLERTPSVSGVLVDADGAPLRGVRLWLRAEAADESDSTTTNADGTFVFDDPPIGRVHVEALDTVTGEPFESPRDGLRLIGTRALEKPERERPAAPAKEQHIVEIEVVDPDGKAVPLCRVWIGHPEPGWITWFEAALATPTGVALAADVIGRWTHEVVGGSMRRSVEGHPPFHVAVVAPRDAAGRPLNLLPTLRQLGEAGKGPVEIRLAAGRTLVGHVVGPDGKGVAGVAVRAAVATATTDDDGRFELGGLDRNDVWLALSPPAGYSKPLPALVRRTGEPPILVLRRGVALGGRVLAPSGALAEEGKVEAKWPATKTSAEGKLKVDLDAGAFRFENLPDDALVRLEVHGDLPAAEVPPADEVVEGVLAGTVDLVIRLTASAVLEGVVVDADGHPARGDLWVTARESGGARERSATVLPNGTFRVLRLRPGRYDLTVYRASDERALDVGSVEAPASGLRLVYGVR